MLLIDLPDDIIINVIFNLNLYDINELCLCSKKFKNIIKENSKYIYKKRKYNKPHGLLKSNNIFEITYVDGLKHGEFILYNNNKIFTKGLFFKNKKHGIWYEYSEKGQVIKEENWYHGILNGFVKKWYNNNDLSSIEFYVNDKKHGEQIYFSIDRNIKYEYWTNDIKDYDIYIIKNKKFKL